MDPSGEGEGNFLFGKSWAYFDPCCQFPPELVLLLPESGGKPIEVPVNGGWVAVDGIFTTAGVLKIPDNCECHVTCKFVPGSDYDPGGPGSGVRLFFDCTCWMGLLGLFWRKVTTQWWDPCVANCFGDNPLTDCIEGRITGGVLTRGAGRETSGSVRAI